MMLKRMREATPKEGLFDSQQSQMMQSMADEQLALHLATRASACREPSWGR